MARALIAVLIVWATATAAVAERRTAYVDEVATYGEVEYDQARTIVERSLGRAGYETHFAPAGRTPCGADAECLGLRARSEGVELAVRVTVLGLAGEVSLSLTGVRANDFRIFKEMADGLDPGTADEHAAATLASWPMAAPRRSRIRPIAGWATAAGAVLLAGAGVWAYIEGRSREEEFFRKHVDSGGNVFGISPEEAQGAEASARRWQLAGGLLIGAAGAAGITATILFAGGSSDEPPRPAGIALGGRF